MTDLLSKDHTILERPFMEFRPFGMDERGEKILDCSGVVVRNNVEYLEACIGRTHVVEAAARAVQQLCDLLNERIWDQAYHVTPKFLRNEWHSYSYEFANYLREFCKVLSGNPQFHFMMGADRIVSPMIQVLGRPFSLRQIFSMYPHFAQKFVRGVCEFEASEVTDHSAVLRQRFTEHALRQLGPYVKACAQNVCDQVKGGMCSVPEKVHGLPRATVRDRLCIAHGDGWCEWEFSWTQEPRTGLFSLIRKWLVMPRSRNGGQG